MAKRCASRRSGPLTVWTLTRIMRTDKMGYFARVTVGQYSSERRAMTQAARIIAAEMGVSQIRLPAWKETAEGGMEVNQGEGRWHFVSHPWLVDSEAA